MVGLALGLLLGDSDGDNVGDVEGDVEGWARQLLEGLMFTDVECAAGVILFYQASSRALFSSEAG